MDPTITPTNPILTETQNELVLTKCKHCDFPIIEKFYFCPNCGKKIKNPPLSTSVFRQIYWYTISILLPPLGLWPGIRYLLSPDKKSKIIGIILIILTIISTIVTLKITIDYMNSQTSLINKQVNQINNFNY